MIERLPFLYELYIEAVYRKKEASLLMESLPSLYQLYIEAVYREKERPPF